MMDPRPDRQARVPSPCPQWCTRDHDTHDHPEDRLHTGEAVIVTGVLGRVDPVTLRPEPRTATLLVQARQWPQDERAWMSVEVEEGDGPRLVLAADLARELGTALQTPP